MLRTTGAVSFGAALLLLTYGCTSSETSDPADPPADTSSGETVAATDEGAPPSDEGPAPTDSGPDKPDQFLPPPDQGPPPDFGPPPPPPDPMVCSGNIEEPLQEFGGACCYTPLAHPQNSNCVWYADGYDGTCLDVQCGSGLCREPYCSKPCTILKDQVNNATLEPGQDGIADEGEFNDCEGAVDGPVGTQMRCVNLNLPENDTIGQCQPGTTFGACESHGDCPASEVCSVMYILGAYQARCRIPAKEAKGMAEECNSDPNSGLTSECAGPYCFGYGCVELCGGDEHCATDTCVGGACTKDPERSCATNADCSAWSCQELTPFSNNAFTDDFCQPKDCTKADDCRDPDWFCRPFWNGADAVEDVGLAHSCRRLEPGTANYGEPCDPSGQSLPDCTFGSACIEGYCSAPCQSDADCPESTECLLGAEWSIDVDDDEEVDTYVSIDMCRVWPHQGEELVDCASDDDCPAGDHCQFRVRGETGDDGVRVWKTEYKCHTDLEGQVDFPVECSEADGQPCKTDLCLVPGGAGSTSPTYCAAYCKAAADCPDQMKYDGLSWKTICLSFRVNHNNTPGLADDTYVPYCRHTSTFGSLKSCEETRSCASVKEYCRALAIAANPDEPVVVEHLCSDVSEGLTAYPTKVVGEACESWTECIGRNCLPDGEGGRYCSELCASDADCVSEDGIDALKCTEVVLIERADPTLSGVTTRCIRQKTCMTCETDGDCGGDHQCVNFGGQGFLADLRCGSPCETDADCLDAGTSCIEDVDPNTAQLTGKRVCGPDFCE